jgi:hypothetical protein
MPRRERRHSALPKGAYPLPDGNYVTDRVTADPESDSGLLLCTAPTLTLVHWLACCSTWPSG